MDSGKRFEERVARSLHELDGASMRVEDGGRGAFNKQLCDFLYWPDRGGTIAIECKAAKDRLELRRLGVGKEDGQLARLLAFQGRGRRSVVAVNFYGDDYRKHNRCYIIPAILFIGVDGASITEEQASHMGIECPKVGDRYDMGCLADWLAYRRAR